MCFGVRRLPHVAPTLVTSWRAVYWKRRYGRLYGIRAEQDRRKRTMTSMVRLAVFVAFVLGGGFLIGYLNVPGGWYAGLNKPWFNPPNCIFAPAWSAIYLLVAIAGWRTWERYGQGSAMRLWLLQMALNFLWSPIFFSAHLPGSALAIIM